MKTPASTTINREACDWVAKLHDGDPTREDLEALQAWADQSPAHIAELRRMAKRWEELNVLTELAVPVELPGTRTIARSWWPVSPFARMGAIGALAAAMVAIAVLWTQFEFGGGERPAVSVYATAIGEQRLVTLADNSTVLLNTNSRIRVDYTDEFRSVYLIHGEAHFNVTSHPERPFQVLAGNGMFRAVGTAFSVYLKEQTVELTVTEGSVEIRNAQEAAGSAEVMTADVEVRPIVEAGQVAVYDQYIESIESIAPIDEVEVSRKLAWQDGQLRFYGDPLGEVVNEVSRYTSLSIVILDPELRDLRIGGNFAVGETEKMFEALETGFNVRVERVNESLVHLSVVSKTPQ